jgi:crotonobetainyl-CoA:carnitine CoA-transferase CaiB-like acyl-CoA transferase
MTRLALEGVRILDLSIVWAGPHCTKTLGDMGADVIKVEALNRLDPIRGPVHATSPREGCYPDRTPGDQPYNRHGYFNERNRNKRGITLDLKAPRGANVFRRLVAVSDVVIDNFAAGVLPRLGFDYPSLAAINPRIIQLSMPSFGTTGPESHYRGYGATNDQLSGIVSVTGYRSDEFENPGINISDPMAGLHAAGAILAALLYRARTGRGQFIDLAHREVATRLLGAPVIDAAVNGRVARPGGNSHPSKAPHGCYPALGDDAWITISVATEEEWRALCAVANASWSSDPRFASAPDRLRNREALDTLIGEWTRTRDPRELMAGLQAAGVTAGAVSSAQDLLADPQLRARGFFETIGRPDLGTYDYLGIAWKMSRTPGRVRMPPPRVGEHTAEVLRELLKMPDDEIAALERDGVVGENPAAVRADPD